VKTAETALKEILTLKGRITIAEFMRFCLTDPEYGYYRSSQAVGRTGDFITAPEISQLFGEMIGISIAETWIASGRPQLYNILECGAGTGTMMLDILRITKAVPNFHKALRVYIYDINETLRSQQIENFSKAGYQSPRHINSIADMPQDAPCFIIGNEFLDVFPIHQLKKTHTGFSEIYVTLDERGELCFGEGDVSPDAKGFEKFLSLDGTEHHPIFEYCPDALDFMHSITDHFTLCPLTMMMIDYGAVPSKDGSSLQAVKSHQCVNPLTHIGQADLTAYVDFAALSRSVPDSWIKFDVIAQAQFLLNCGVLFRARQLAKSRPDKEAEIFKSLNRLLDVHQMGHLFKVWAISNQDIFRTQRLKGF
jgi:NADH dehydrogenase [ubiquinone] 1 alpha subcomplex assembly factor 7